ncbi:MAG: BspA family leucine-rich repeat surface protein [Firmicutes bacterium]|nr:BspA family leucine-rich repeat surface protein [Bacillota bacterium]MDY5586351.1 BspA family leucine-rich repeat surface protein [Eubacteriales bacterium]
MKEDRKNNAERDAVQTILSGKYKRSLTFKLVCFSAFFVITALTCIVGVWAAQRVSITTSGSISYVATDVNATITGTISGSQTNPSLSTLTYTATSEPTSAELATWQDLDLKFKANAEDVVISITIKNNSTERKLNYTIADTVATSSNLSKTISGGNSGEIGFGDSKVITITFKVIDKNKSVENTSFNYVVRLNDPSYTPPAGGFLMTGEKWQQKIKDTIPGYTNSAVTSISFTKTRPTTGTPVSVGACDEGGTTPYSAAAALPTTKDVTAYVTETDGSYSIVFYCPETIYAPTDSSYLFANREYCVFMGAWNGLIYDSQYDTAEKIGELLNSPEFNDIGSKVFQQLTQISLDNFNSSLATKTAGMFATGSELILDKNQTSKIDVSNSKDISLMFSVKQLEIDFSTFNISNATKLVQPFGVENFTANWGKAKLNPNATDIRGLYASSTITNEMLEKLNSFKSITDMSYLFSGSDLTNADLSKLNTSNVTNMAYMFQSAKSSSGSITLTFDTSNVTSMDGMFCSSKFTSINLSGLNTSNVTNMAGMFSGCINVTNLNLSGFNTSKVTNMEYMFGTDGDGWNYGGSGLTSLETLDISMFDMSSVTNAEDMLQNGASNTACYKVIKTPKKLNASTTIKLSESGAQAQWKIEGDTSGTTYTEITATNGTLGKTLIKVS